MEKPVLILTAIGIRSDMGSEPGKAWGWANALDKFYRLEVLTLPSGARHFEERGTPEGWRVHGVGEEFSPGPARAYYAAYRRWCERALDACREILRAGPVAGLHHVTLGSFRVLPRYDRLGIPYTVGPLGGGESIPWALLPQLRLPAREVAVEAARSPVNYAFAALPSLRAVFKHSRMTLATTRETLDVLTALGATRAAVAFPDAFEGGGEDAAVLGAREAQAAALPARVRCLCAGRVLWWKGMHLGVEFVGRLRQRGVEATLDVYGDGPALPVLRERTARLGLTPHVTFHGTVGRDTLMRGYADAHLFVYPTTHDSSSLAILEAYSLGLPTMTLGLSGPATVATPATGLNDRVRSIDDWLEAGCRTVAGWRDDPASWLRVCRAARERSRDFGFDHLERCVREHLNPVFLPSAA